jgi:putative addiction module component (TIGR02574 family)
MDYQTIVDAVRTLPTEDQARLVLEIRDELIVQDDALTPEFMEELDRRLADMEANPDDCVPWETVLAEARARHGR